MSHRSRIAVLVLVGAVSWVTAFAVANSPPAPVMEAKRIAALAPSLTELVFAAGAGERLVAVSAYSDYPEAAKRLPQAADGNGVRLEALAALQPDLVLVWGSGTREADVVRMRSLGMRVEAIEVRLLTDVGSALRRIAALTGTTQAGEAAARTFERRLQVLTASRRMRGTTGGAEGPRVFFEISAMPLLTVGGGHFISEVLALCGFRNVFADQQQPVFEPSRESLLRLAPQYVFYPRGRQGRGAGSFDHYHGTPAAQAGRFIGIEADHILRPGPRLIDAAETVCGVAKHGTTESTR